MTTSNKAVQPVDWIDIRDPDTNHLICRFSRSCGIIEIRQRGKTYTIVLAGYQTVEGLRVEAHDSDRS